MMKKLVTLLLSSAFSMSSFAFSVHNDTDLTAHVYFSYDYWYFDHDYDVAPHSDFDYSEGMKPGTTSFISVYVETLKYQGGSFMTETNCLKGYFDIATKFTLAPDATSRTGVSITSNR